jgi:hypothetical protein
VPREVEGLESGEWRVGRRMLEVRGWRLLGRLRLRLRLSGDGNVGGGLPGCKLQGPRFKAQVEGSLGVLGSELGIMDCRRVLYGVASKRSMCSTMQGVAVLVRLTSSS